MFTSIDVKFNHNFRFHLSVLRNIQLKEMFCPTEILQMEAVNPSIWICCSCYVFGQQFGYFFFAKRVKCSAILYCFYQKTCPRPQDSSVAVPFPGDYSALFLSFCGLTFCPNFSKETNL